MAKMKFVERRDADGRIIDGEWMATFGNAGHAIIRCESYGCALVEVDGRYTVSATTRRHHTPANVLSELECAGIGEDELYHEGIHDTVTLPDGRLIIVSTYYHVVVDDKNYLITLNEPIATFEDAKAEAIRMRSEL